MQENYLSAILIEIALLLFCFLVNILGFRMHDNVIWCYLKPKFSTMVNNRATVNLS